MTLPSTGRRPRPTVRTRPGLMAVLSVGAAALGLLSLADPARNPLLSETGILALVDLIPPTVTALVMLATGLLGLVTAAALRPGAENGGWVTALLAAQCLGYLVLVSSTDLLVLFGYLLAFILPLGLAVLLVLGCRAYVLVRYLAVLFLAAVATWGYVTSALTWSNVSSTFGNVARALGEQGFELLSLAWLAAGALASLLTLGGVLRSATHGSGFERWLVRHSVAVTVVAAAGPLPYALVRATWLTPWPVGAPGGVDYGIRLWGLLLGGAAVLGVVLTLGLILPWGRVFPRWMLGLAGRPVPPALAIVPGASVALALIMAAVWMPLSFAGEGLVMFLAAMILFPCWIWGPALALAVWAYAVRRRAEQDGGVPRHDRVAAGQSAG
jgi:hypothetical protein